MFLSQCCVITSEKVPFNRAKVIWTNRCIPGYRLSTTHRSSLSIQLPSTHPCHSPVWVCWMRGKPLLQAYHYGMHNKVVHPCWPGIIHSLPTRVHVGDTRPSRWSKGGPGVQCICLQRPWMPFEYCVLPRVGANCNQNQQMSSQRYVSDGIDNIYWNGVPGKFTYRDA